MSHIKFKPELLQYRDIEMYKASIAAGGFLYARVNGVDKKVPMPVAVCRRNGNAYYSNPVKIRVLFYGDDAINFEHINSVTSDMLHEKLDDFKKLIEGEQLYYDGTLIYSLDYVPGTLNLDSTGFMQHVRLPTYNPSILLSETISGPAFYDTVKCKNVIGFPIWSEVESSFLKYSCKKEDYLFDHVDERYSVNLQSLLKICKMSSKQFGTESIECFKLVDYMYLHRTVNLPSLSNRVRTTSLTGLRYTDAIAFHIGKIKKCKTYMDIKNLKQSLQNTLSYGIIRNDIFDRSKIYLTDTIPELISVDRKAAK